MAAVSKLVCVQGKLWYIYSIICIILYYIYHSILRFYWLNPLLHVYIYYVVKYGVAVQIVCVSLSRIHYMITQSVRISEPNPMPTSSNPSQMNILQLLLKIFLWWILYISIHSTTLIWLPVRDTDSGKWGDWWRYMPKWNLNIERIGVAEKS